MESNQRTPVPGPEGARLIYLGHLFSAEAGWPLAPVMACIVEEGRCVAKPADFVGQLCSKLVEAGAPAWRLGLDVATIHPRFAAGSSRGPAQTVASMKGRPATASAKRPPTEQARGKVYPRRDR